MKGKKGFTVLLVALWSFILACEAEEEPSATADVTPDQPPDLPPELRPDLPPEVRPDLPPEVTPELPPEVPIEIVPEVGGPYGTIDADFHSEFIFDYTRLEDTTYLQSHPEGIQMTPAFSGSYGPRKTIPGWGATQTIAIAVRVPAEGTDPPMIGVIQQSAARETPVNPWVDLLFFTDNITPGVYRVGFTQTDQALLRVINILPDESICILALAFGGTINVVTASNTTAVDGGTLAFNGSGIQIYHPTNTPLGDISGEIIRAGGQVCPIE